MYYQYITTAPIPTVGSENPDKARVSRCISNFALLLYIEYLWIIHQAYISGVLAIHEPLN